MEARLCYRAARLLLVRALRFLTTVAALAQSTGPGDSGRWVMMMMVMILQY